MTASPAGLVGHHASPITKLYHHVDQKMSWTDAQRYCREQFHDLATIDNLEDLERLQASRRGSDYDIDTAWIGLYDDRTRWQWSHGNQDYKMGQDYDNWAGDEPNNVDAKQNCTVIMPQTGEWSDRRCSDLACPVCINGALDLYLLNTKVCFCSRFNPIPFTFNLKKNNMIFLQIELTM